MKEERNSDLQSGFQVSGELPAHVLLKKFFNKSLRQEESVEGPVHRLRAFQRPQRPLRTICSGY